MPTPQGRYWMLTIPVVHMETMIALDDTLCYLKGQQEIGGQGLLHWQVLAVTSRKCSRAQVKALFCPQAHVELTRSEAANDYVWKDETSVEGTRFCLGALPLSRARPQDWNKIFTMAKDGSFEEIPKDILIRHYSSLKRIYVDNCEPEFRENMSVKVFYGPTGTGKTRRAWDEAMALGDRPYIKNPNTKWWDGYRGQKNVIIDEFSGRIDISYLLTWLDRYPVISEVKGYSLPMTAINFWITSNMHPNEWYADAIPAHKDALLRRIHQMVLMETHYVETVRDELFEIFN